MQIQTLKERMEMLLAPVP